MRNTTWKDVALILIYATLIVAIFAVVPGCRTTQGGGGQLTSRVVNCSTEAVRDAWPRAYPEVMHCLTAIMEAPMTCLDAIPTAVQVGIDTVACIVRGAHVEAARQSERSPGDTVSLRKAERSRAWLDSKGLVFE